VNSEDLADALEKKQIFGAGLDVIMGEPNITGDHRLVKLSNCESGDPISYPYRPKPSRPLYHLALTERYLDGVSWKTFVTLC
jgi:hypothetical protein